MLTINYADCSAIDELAANLHPDDAAELAAAGTNLHQALRDAPLQALRWHDQLVCLFGCVRHPVEAAVGIPWMLCTQALHEVPARQMALISRAVVIEWRAEFRALCNMVHRRNARALRFVNWLGFTVNNEPCGPGQEFFIFDWSGHV